MHLSGGFWSSAQGTGKELDRTHHGVGIAPTKTLAKSAQWATKQWPQFSGVVALTAENRNRILKLLGLQPVGEVWGVGRRLTEKLNALGINTALQLAQANTAFIRKNFSIILERTVRELNGESCISLEEAPPAKQQIVCSRSFGERITDKMPCTRLLFSMQSGPLRNYVGSVSIVGR